MQPTKYFVTVDVVFVVEHHVLLIKRKNPPFQFQWALPGGFVDPHENLTDAAGRELKEETGVSVQKLDEIGAFGDPDRDPRGRVISIAYFASESARPDVKAADDAEDHEWFDLYNLPDLAFDHQKIITSSEKFYKS